MAGNDGGNSRIADLMQGHPLTFGGIGIASWRSESEPQPAVRQFGAPAGFQVYMDEEKQPPTESRLRAKVFRPSAAAAFPVNDENRPPADARLRAKTFSQAAAGGGFTVFTDKENRPPPAVKPFGAVSDFQVYTERESAAPAVNRPRPKTYGQAAASGLQPDADENRQRAKPQAARADESRPARAQQRKQKLKQRPLQDLQNTKRAALQPLPVSAAATRLPTLFSIHQDAEQQAVQETLLQPLPVSAAATRLPTPFAIHQDAEQQAVQETLLRPAPATASDAPMASPESLHSSFDSITISARRGRLDALFSYEEYAADLYLIMRQVELEHRPRADFMARQPDITVTMRSILVDWLVEVNDEYKLNAETLHLAVNYIDRFLSVMTVVRAKLQLVGTTALFIASKFEEIYPPTVAEFVYITDDTYTASQLKRMEHVMLKMLAFDMSAPTSNWFLNYFIDNGGAGEDTVRHLAQFLVELTLVQYGLCNKYVNSVQAGAALCLARLSTGHEPWTPLLERLSGLSREELRPCVEELLAVYQTARDLPQQAVLDKFAKDKFVGVSQLEPPTALWWN